MPDDFMTMPFRELPDIPVGTVPKARVDDDSSLRAFSYKDLFTQDDQDDLQPISYSDLFNKDDAQLAHAPQSKSKQDDDDLKAVSYNDVFKDKKNKDKGFVRPAGMTDQDILAHLTWHLGIDAGEFMSYSKQQKQNAIRFALAQHKLDLDKGTRGEEVPKLTDAQKLANRKRVGITTQEDIIMGDPSLANDPKGAQRLQLDYLAQKAGQTPTSLDLSGVFDRMPPTSRYIPTQQEKDLAKAAGFDNETFGVEQAKMAALTSDVRLDEIRRQVQIELSLRRKDLLDAPPTQANSAMLAADALTTPESIDVIARERLYKEQEKQRVESNLRGSYTPEEKKWLNDQRFVLASQNWADQGLGRALSESFGEQFITHGLDILAGVSDLIAGPANDGLYNNNQAKQYFARQALLQRDSIEQAEMLNPKTTATNVMKVGTDLGVGAGSVGLSIAALGPIGGMVLPSMLGALGRSESLEDIGKDTAESAAIGLLFHNTAGMPLLERMSSIGLGTFAIHEATGRSHEDALKSALTNMLATGLMAPEVLGAPKQGLLELTDRTTISNLPESVRGPATRAYDMLSRGSREVSLDPQTASTIYDKLLDFATNGREEFLRLPKGQQRAIRELIGTLYDVVPDKTRTFFNSQKEIANAAETSRVLLDMPDEMRQNANIHLTPRQHELMGRMGDLTSKLGNLNAEVAGIEWTTALNMGQALNISRLVEPRPTGIDFENHIKDLLDPALKGAIYNRTNVGPGTYTLGIEQAIAHRNNIDGILFHYRNGDNPYFLTPEVASALEKSSMQITQSIRAYANEGSVELAVKKYVTGDLDKEFLKNNILAARLTSEQLARLEKQAVTHTQEIDKQLADLTKKKQNGEDVTDREQDLRSKRDENVRMATEYAARRQRLLSQVPAWIKDLPTTNLTPTRYEQAASKLNEAEQGKVSVTEPEPEGIVYEEGKQKTYREWINEDNSVQSKAQADAAYERFKLFNDRPAEINELERSILADVKNQDELLNVLENEVDALGTDIANRIENEINVPRAGMETPVAIREAQARVDRIDPQTLRDNPVDLPRHIADTAILTGFDLYRLGVDGDKWIEQMTMHFGKGVEPVLLNLYDSIFRAEPDSRLDEKIAAWADHEAGLYSQLTNEGKFNEWTSREGYLNRRESLFKIPKDITGSPNDVNVAIARVLSRKSGDLAYLAAFHVEDLIRRKLLDRADPMGSNYDVFRNRFIGALRKEQIKDIPEPIIERAWKDGTAYYLANDAEPLFSTFKMFVGGLDNTFTPERFTEILGDKFKMERRWTIGLESYLRENKGKKVNKRELLQVINNGQVHIREQVLTGSNTKFGREDYKSEVLETPGPRTDYSETILVSPNRDIITRLTPAQFNIVPYRGKWIITAKDPRLAEVFSANTRPIFTGTFESLVEAERWLGDYTNKNRIVATPERSRGFQHPYFGGSYQGEYLGREAIGHYRHSIRNILDTRGGELGQALYADEFQSDKSQLAYKQYKHFLIQAAQDTIPKAKQEIADELDLITPTTINSKVPVSRIEALLREHAKEVGDNDLLMELDKQGYIGELDIDPFYHKYGREMMFKHFLRTAIDKGVNGIAWTTSEIQAERYHKVIRGDSIIVQPLPIGDGTFEYEVRINNDIRWNDLYNTPVSIDRIRQDLGDKYADAVVKSKRDIDPNNIVINTYKPVILSKGPIEIFPNKYKGYDNEYVNMAKAFAKKYGGTVRKENIVSREADPGLKIEVKDREDGDVEVYQDGKLMTLAPKGSDAVKYWEYLHREPRSAGTTQVHYMDITPSLRNAIKKEGLPYYGITNPFVDALKGQDNIGARNAVTNPLNADTALTNIREAIAEIDPMETHSTITPAFEAILEMYAENTPGSFNEFVDALKADGIEFNPELESHVLKAWQSIKFRSEQGFLNVEDIKNIIGAGARLVPNSATFARMWKAMGNTFGGGKEGTGVLPELGSEFYLPGKYDPRKLFRGIALAQSYPAYADVYRILVTHQEVLNSIQTRIMGLQRDGLRGVSKEENLKVGKLLVETQKNNATSTVGRMGAMDLAARGISPQGVTLYNLSLDSAAMGLKIRESQLVTTLYQNLGKMPRPNMGNITVPEAKEVIRLLTPTNYNSAFNPVNNVYEVFDGKVLKATFPLEADAKSWMQKNRVYNSYTTPMLQMAGLSPDGMKLWKVTKIQNEIKDIRSHYKELRDKGYMPLMRSGKYAVVGFDPTKQIGDPDRVHFAKGNFLSKEEVVRRFEADGLQGIRTYASSKQILNELRSKNSNLRDMHPHELETLLTSAQVDFNDPEIKKVMDESKSKFRATSYQIPRTYTPGFDPNIENIHRTIQEQAAIYSTNFYASVSKDLAIDKLNNVNYAHIDPQVLAQTLARRTGPGPHKIALGEIDPSLHAITERFIHDETTPDANLHPNFRRARLVTSIMMLAFEPGQFYMNAFVQPVQQNWGWAAKHYANGIAGAEVNMLKAAKLTSEVLAQEGANWFRDKAGKSQTLSGNIPPEFQTLFRQLAEARLVSAEYTKDLVGAGAREHFVNNLFVLSRAGERVTRTHQAALGYYVGTEVYNLSGKDLYRFVADGIHATQSRVGRGENPAVFRNDITKLLYQFNVFNHMWYENLGLAIKNDLSQITNVKGFKGKLGALSNASIYRHMGGLLLTAGLNGLPLYGVMNTIANIVTGGRNIEDIIEDLIGKGIISNSLKFGITGLAGEELGRGISSRASARVPIIDTTRIPPESVAAYRQGNNWNAIMGVIKQQAEDDINLRNIPAWALLNKVVTTSDYASMGSYYRAGETIAPRFIGAGMKAYRYDTEGFTEAPRRGQINPRPMKDKVEGYVRKPNKAQTIFQFMGVNNSDLLRHRENQKKEVWRR